MIKNYDPNIWDGWHTIRFTLQCWDYVGHVAKRIGGNCHGHSVLNDEFWETDAQEDIDRYVENDCELAIDEDSDIYTATLTNPEGDTLEVDWEPDELADSVVAIEIIDYVKEK